MKKFLAIFLTILSVALLMCACGDKYVSKYDEDYVYDGTSLIGKWRESKYSDEYYQVYEITENEITLTAYSYGLVMQEITAVYTVEGDNTLVVSWGDGYTDRNDFSIAKGPVFVLTQVVDSSTSEMELVPYDLTWNTNNSDIVGTWVSDDSASDTFTFKSNYTLLVEGQYDIYTVPYAIKDSTLAISGEFVDGFKEEANVLSYKIEGDKLTLTGTNEDGNAIAITVTRSK